MLTKDPVVFMLNVDVMVDDKPQLLAAMKRVLGARLTTVFVRQGHYAAESVCLGIDPPPDLTIEQIGNLCDVALSDFHAATTRIVDTDREQTPEAPYQEHS